MEEDRGPAGRGAVQERGSSTGAGAKGPGAAQPTGLPNIQASMMNPAGKRGLFFLSFLRAAAGKSWVGGGEGRGGAKGPFCREVRDLQDPEAPRRVEFPRLSLPPAGSPGVTDHHSLVKMTRHEA